LHKTLLIRALGQYTLFKRIKEAFILGKMICEFTLNRKITKFDIYAISYAHRSKKARSDTIRVREGGNLFYRYVGKIIKFRKAHNPINTSILLRNVLDLASFELVVPVISSLVTNFFVAMIRKCKILHAYHLRWVAPVKSKVTFQYVMEDDIIYE
jgi:ribosomal protein L19